MRKFEVEIYYSGYCTVKVDAENSDDAILVVRKMDIDDGELRNEVLGTLTRWEEADQSTEVR